MSFIIFGDLFSFPDGSAATNRVYTYAKGLKNRGINVHVICFANNYLDRYEGEVEKIKYYHPFAQRTRNKYFIVRRWLNLKKYVRTYKILRQINKEDKIIAVNSWTNNLQTHLIIWFICKLLRTKLIVECNEHPLRYFQQNFFRKLSGRAKFFIESRLSSAVFCISRYLVEFYAKSGINRNRLLLIPSTVDPTRFDSVVGTVSPVSYRYIGYFGSLTFRRDNIDMLVNSFSRFNKEFPDIRLVLGGFCSPEQKNELMNLIKDNKVEDSVILLEYLSRGEILQYVFHADVLVLVRRNDLEAEASYPSKLTEFLATGKPVVTVNVGEVTDFIIDQENGFVIPAGNIDQLYNKLNYIFNNYDEAKRIGIKGKELTSGLFNYNFQAGRILDFIGEISSDSPPAPDVKPVSRELEKVDEVAS